MIKALIIDDEYVVLNVLEELLRGEGYEVKTALSGKEGLVLFEEWNPDIVLLDKNLPDVSGLDIAKELKKKDAQVAIIMITAYPSAESIKEAMRVGVFSYITKPFEDINEILKTMKKAEKVIGLKKQIERLKTLNEEMRKRTEELRRKTKDLK